MDAARTTVRDLRRHNRSVLLSRLFFDGPLSRHELARLSGLSAATVDPKREIRYLLRAAKEPEVASDRI